MRSRGFSLIEVLIVVAIILVIAAIAVPRFLNSRMAANEASAVSSIRQINTAETSYTIAYTSGYADDLAKLGPPTSGAVDSAHAGLIDWVLGCASQPCSKSGYQFAIVNATGTPVVDYSITGVPVSVGQTGRRGFCGNRSNNISFDTAGGTNCTTPLQ
jgi:type IV pilus assembly protein PilA